MPKSRRSPRSNWPTPADTVRHYDSFAREIGSLDWYHDGRVLDAVSAGLSLFDKKIIDLCCGSGILLSQLARLYQAQNFIGIDISPQMLHEARKSVEQIKNLCFHEGDWLDTGSNRVDFATCDVVLVKNSLHLLEEVEEKLVHLNDVVGKHTRIIIIETVSPNQECQDFVARVFSSMGLNQIKKNIFTVKTLHALLQNCFKDREITNTVYVRQEIDVEKWLCSKKISEQRRDVANFIIRSAYEHLNLRKSMRLTLNEAGYPRSMLRLQAVKFISEIRPRKPDASFSRMLGVENVGQV